MALSLPRMCVHLYFDQKSVRFLTLMSRNIFAKFKLFREPLIQDRYTVHSQLEKSETLGK